MNASALVSPLVVKEVRALFPGWIACVATILGTFVMLDVRTFDMGLLAYALGAAMLGAQSVGHEYTYRTLGLYLAQPSERRRLLLIKVGVLAVMLLALATLGSAVLLNDTNLRGPIRSIRQPVLILAVPCGFFIAPWLTMMTRSPLAGLVFSMVVPPMLLILGDIIGAARFGMSNAGEIDRFKMAFLWRGMLVVCAVAAVSSWRMFMRLEAIDGRGPEIDAPRWWPVSGATESVSVAPVRHRRPVWSIVKKEVRLQQMTFVVVGLYILSLTTLSVVQHFVVNSDVIPVGAVSVLYFSLLAILIGSLASAEERQFGTAEWHVLLPMAAWKQWLLKAGVALTLALLLGVAVALGITSVLPFAGHVSMAPRGWLTLAGLVVLLTSTALYVSSLTSSGVWAMVLSLAVIVGANAFIPMFASTIWRWVSRLIIDSVGTSLPAMSRATRIWTLDVGFTGLAVLFGAGLVALLLRFGFLNHRSAERGLVRLRAQAIALGAYLTLASFLLLAFLMVVSRAARAG